MKKRLWSEEDIEYLKKFYPVLGYVIIADDLNLPVNTVRNKVKYLKLRRQNLPNRWSKEEIDFLQKFYPEKGTRFVAMELNRPLLSVHNKASRMKIKGYIPFKWSEEEVALLKKLYPKYCAEKVAEKLGRKCNSVIDKASKLKLRKSHKWSDFEKNFLKKNFSLKPIKTISKILGIPRKAVKDMAYKMKIYEVKNQKWTDEQVAYLKKNFPDRSITITEIAAFLGVSESAVTNKANDLKLHRYYKIGSTEKKYIVSHYKKLSYKEMARNLDVSADSLRRFCIMNGFKRPPLKIWSVEEKSFLQNNYKIMSIDDLANILGRTEYSIQKQASFLGLKKF